MKTLKEALSVSEALFSRKNIKLVELPYGLTKDDLKGEIKDFPMGVVVRMMEEQELQGNKSSVEVFQKNRRSGFEWSRTEAGGGFWVDIIAYKFWNVFFKRYPEYEKYNL